MVVLKNMKKTPKSCGECPFGDCGCKLLKMLGDGKREYLTYSTMSRTDCPLVDMKYELNSRDHEILDNIYDHFRNNLGEYAHYHSVASFRFTEDAGPYTPYSEITIELCDGSTIKYSRPKD